MHANLRFSEYVGRREQGSSSEGLVRSVTSIPTDAVRWVRDPVAERSLYPLLGKAVNPARPISPLNSTLLAPPGRRRLKSQVMGR